MLGATVDQAIAIVNCVRAELLLFGVAFTVHYLLFGNVFSARTSKKATLQAAAARKRQSSAAQHEDELAPGAIEADVGQALTHAEAAYERGDHRTLLRCWAAMLQKSDQVPATLLAHVVEAMQRFKKDGRMILSEVRGYLQRQGTACDIGYINRLLEPLAKSLDTAVVDGIVQSLTELAIKPDATTYEILVLMHFATRSFDEVFAATKELRMRGLEPTPRTSLALLKTSLHLGNLDEAVQSFRRVAATGHDSGASSAPRHVAAQLVELACREHRADVVMSLLEADMMPFSVEMMNTLLTECVRTKDLALAERAEKLRVKHDVARSSRTWSLLMRAGGGSSDRVTELLDELRDAGEALTPEIAQAVLATCGQTGDSALADRLLALLETASKTEQGACVPALAQLVRFYAEAGQPAKACDIYEARLKSLKVGGGSSGELREQRKFSSSVLDARTEKSLVAAALQCGRQDIATALLETAPTDTARHIAMIRGCAARGNLEEAMQTFRTLEDSGAELTHSLWNTALDACVECRDLRQAEALMKRMQAAEVADAVSFNTMIKASLRQENYDRARGLMEEMKQAGCAPNHVTYNELINSLVRYDRHRQEVWDVVGEMARFGVQPNRVTCSILLKSLKAKSGQADITRTLDLIDKMVEPMDEVLLSSVVEALVRIGNTRLLAEKLQQFHGRDGIKVAGAHTFGSLIKAYGYVKDVASSWKCWKEMRSQHVRPTGITIGCMVEAVVTNGDVDGGYELLQSLLEDQQCKEQVNAVVFGSVLKGYSRARRIDRVWAVLREMLSRGIEPSVVTFNAVVDACARNGQMERVPELLGEMRGHGLQPNLITYSTIIKGYCQRGDIAAGFATLGELRKHKELKADEVVFNTLLDGCAQAGLAADAERLLEEMQAEGVAPSAFTLTVLVKLNGQVRRLDRAFELFEDLTQRHWFRPNTHVYSALVQACLTSHEVARAAATCDRAFGERVQVDQRICQSLVRALLAAGQHVRAVSMLRVMLGLNGQQPMATPPNERGGNPVFDESFVREVTAVLVSAGGDAAPLAGKLQSDYKVAGHAGGGHHAWQGGDHQHASWQGNRGYGGGYGGGGYGRGGYVGGGGGGYGSGQRRGYAYRERY